MIDVREAQQRMQRSVDGCRASIQIESAMRKIAHHLIFVSDASIERLQPEQFIKIQCREPCKLHGAQVAPRSLDVEYVHPLAAQGIPLAQLRRCVAAAKIGDGQIRTQKIRSIQQQSRRVERRRMRLVPTILRNIERHRRLNHLPSFTRQITR
jgi:hypothetical protein